MTCAEAKTITILDVCQRLGAKLACANYGKAYALFHAPYREDQHPSMKVDLTRNRWYDLATGQQGDVIDLVCLTNHTCIADALAYLDRGASSLCKPLPLKKEKVAVVDGMTVMTLCHPALIDYLKSRGIAPEIAGRFCLEAHYVSPKGISCFAIAFPSKSGGYELRNRRFKGCRGPKDVTVVGRGSTFLFFEGFLDFLSHIQLYGYMDDYTYVVLNSTSNVGRALATLKSFPLPTSIEIWLDNDAAGRLATVELIKHFPQAVDMSIIYANYNDLNDYYRLSYKNKRGG